MCASRDGLPLVGAVPGKDNAWITVGFHGESGIVFLLMSKDTACLVFSLWPSRLLRISVPEAGTVTFRDLSRSLKSA